MCLLAIMQKKLFFAASIFMYQCPNEHSWVSIGRNTNKIFQAVYSGFSARKKSKFCVKFRLNTFIFIPVLIDELLTYSHSSPQK